MPSWNQGYLDYGFQQNRPLQLGTIHKTKGLFTITGKLHMYKITIFFFVSVHDSIPQPLQPQGRDKN